MDLDVTVRMLVVATLATASTQALAGITTKVSLPSAADNELVDPRTGDISGGYEDRTPGQRGVRSADLASVSLNVTTLNGLNHPVNLGGDTAVLRGPTFVTLGAHRFGTADVLAQWDEVVNSGRTFVNLAIKSSNEAGLIPAGASVDGSGIATWNWRFGLTDPVDYEPSVTSVVLRSATAFYSRNGGRSFFSSQIFSPNLPPNFMPGRDPGVPLVTAGDGTNYVLLRYEIDVTVPAPSALGLLAGTALAFRRRR